jgi:hypothetical protein
MQKLLLTTIFLCLIFLVSEKAQSQNITWDWLKGEGSPNNENANGMAVDANNNRYVIGQFDGSAFIVGGNHLLYHGMFDIFLIKYDSSGNFQWIRPAGGPGLDVAKNIGIDNSGNIYIAGFYHDSITFKNIVLKSFDNPDFWASGAFIVKYNSSGDLIWAKSSECDISFHRTSAIDFVLDSICNIYMLGLYSTDIMFDTVSFSQNTGVSAYVVKFDSSGAALWGKSILGLTYADGKLALDPNGNIFIGSSYDEDVIIGTDTLPHGQNNDFCVIKLDNTGTLQWMKSSGGSEDETFKDIYADSNGNPVMVGFSNSPTITIGNHTYTNPVGYKSYVIQYDANGNINWGYSDAAPFLYCIEEDTIGNIYTAGGDFDGIVLIKLNNTGTVMYRTHEGGINDYAYSLAISASNRIYLAGSFVSPVINSGSFTLTNQGISDLFVGEVGITIGVEEYLNDNFSIFPNPVSDFINIKMNHDLPFILELYDSLGKIILQQNISETTAIDISELSSGLYFLIMRDKDNKVNSFKIVK